MLRLDHEYEWRFALAALLALGCDPRRPDAPDAADAATDGSAGEAEVAQPAPPDLDCTGGWGRADDQGLEVCDAVADACADLEVRVPTRGCVRIGSACPTGQWAADLPTDRPVYYVHASSAEGDGTRERPLAPIQAVLHGTPGVVLALAKGTYDATFWLSPGVTVIGACPEETIVRGNGDSAQPVFGVLGAGVEIRNLQIRDGSGVGVVADQRVGGLLEVLVEDVAINGTVGYGLASLGGARLVARRVLIADITALPSAMTGGGARVDDGVIEVRESEIRNCVERGVVAYGATALATVEDVSISDIRWLGDPPIGVGLTASMGAHVDARRTVIERAQGTGVAAIFASSEVVLDQVIVRDTQPNPLYDSGIGVTLNSGAISQITHSRIEGGLTTGLYVGAGSVLRLEDSVIQRTQPFLDGMFGFGLWIDDARGELTRVLVRHNYSGGVYSLAGNMTLRDVEIRDSIPYGDLGFGRGAELQGASSVQADRLRLQSNYEVSLYVSGGSSFRATNLAILDTIESTCTRSTCNGAGYGLTVRNGAAVDLDGFVIRGNALAGIQLLEGGELDIRNGVVSENPIGLSIQRDGYDRARAADGVSYEENGRNIESAALPVVDDWLPEIRVEDPT